MAMTRASFKKQLQEGLNTNFGLAYSEHPLECTQIFDIEMSRKAFEEDQLLAGFGEAPVKAEGKGVFHDNSEEGWTARYTHETIAMAFSITEEAEEDGLYGKLGAKYSKALGRSMRETKEIKGANVLNNGFDSSFLGGDGVELFSLLHPLQGGGTFANELTTPADLSETSLEEVLIAIRKFRDDRGLFIAVKPTKLIIPPELEYEAYRIVKSTDRSGTADNDTNAIRSKGIFSNDPAVITRLTDADAWFVRTDCPDGMKLFERVKMKRKIEGDFESGNMRYRARERYSFGFTDPRGMFGSAGSA